MKIFLGAELPQNSDVSDLPASKTSVVYPPLVLLLVQNESHATTRNMNDNEVSKNDENTI